MSGCYSDTHIPRRELPVGGLAVGEFDGWLSRVTRIGGAALGCGLKPQIPFMAYAAHTIGCARDAVIERGLARCAGEIEIRV